MYTVPSNSVSSSSSSSHVVHPSDQVVAQQFYQQLNEIEQQINFHYSCPGVAGTCTAGVVADCSLPATAIGLMESGCLEAGIGFLFLYAAIGVGTFFNNIPCFPFCVTNKLMERRQNTMSNASIPSHWRLNQDVYLLLQKWQSDLEAQANAGNINLQQLSADRTQRSVNDIVAVKTMIANVYLSKYKHSIEDGIKQSDTTPLLTPSLAAQME